MPTCFDGAGSFDAGSALHTTMHLALLCHNHTGEEYHYPHISYAAWAAGGCLLSRCCCASTSVCLCLSCGSLMHISCGLICFPILKVVSHCILHILGALYSTSTTWHVCL